MYFVLINLWNENITRIKINKGHIKLLKPKVFSTSVFYSSLTLSASDLKMIRVH